jgi:phosphoglucomutase
MGIHFGTSGWRAVIGDEFTFANMGNVTKAICSYLGEVGLSKKGPVVIGHDTRFLGETFAEECAGCVTSAGLQALLCDGFPPTPCIAHAIRAEKGAAGINFTASHNPPEYNGMKLSTADGAPALPEVTARVEQLVSEFQRTPADQSAEIHYDSFDPRPGYLEDLEKKISFETIAKANGRYALDPLWGTGRGYLDEVLKWHGLEVETIHNWRDVTFGGRAPEPETSHLGELIAAVRSKGFSLGLATDGDSDRFGVIDADGSFVTPNQLIALLFDYLVDSRGWTGGVARSVATSHLVDRVAKERDREIYETPVGFKFIGELINEDKIVLGGEESAGLSIKGHYPEKDGILACLLAAEAVAARGATLCEQLDALYSRVGRVESGRIGVRLTPELASTLPAKLKQDPKEIGGRKIAEINRLDGLKCMFEDGSWLLMRPSGTEPLVRVYAESESKQDVEVLLEQGRKYLLA